MIVPLAILLFAWLGANVLDKQGERKRQAAVEASCKNRQQNVLPIQDPENRNERFPRAPAAKVPMLSVGRETDIREKDVVCLACSWEGIGSKLSTGLVRIENSRMFLFAYCCPTCGSFELSRKGKLLAFGPHNPMKQQQAAVAEEQRQGAAKGSLSQWK